MHPIRSNLEGKIDMIVDEEGNLKLTAEMSERTRLFPAQFLIHRFAAVLNQSRTSGKRVPCHRDQTRCISCIWRDRI
jgi:hypothetical protein